MAGTCDGWYRCWMRTASSSARISTIDCFGAAAAALEAIMAEEEASGWDGDGAAAAAAAATTSGKEETPHAGLAADDGDMSWRGISAPGMGGGGATPFFCWRLELKAFSKSKAVPKLTLGGSTGTAFEALPFEADAPLEPFPGVTSGLLLAGAIIGDCSAESAGISTLASTGTLGEVLGFDIFHVFFTGVVMSGALLLGEEVDMKGNPGVIV